MHCQYNESVHRKEQHVSFIDVYLLLRSEEFNAISLTERNSRQLLSTVSVVTSKHLSDIVHQSICNSVLYIFFEESCTITTSGHGDNVMQNMSRACGIVTKQSCL